MADYFAVSYIEGGEPIALFILEEDANDYVSVWASGAFRKFIRPVVVSVA